MKRLILIAHGSRREASNTEVRALTRRLADRVRYRFDSTTCAFLEFAEPSIPAAIDAAVEAGGREITILPYFLAGGAHVCEDIPQLVAAKRAQHPTVTIELTPHIGAAPAMIELLASTIA